ncbi:hypothetical protein [Microbacterium gorillae]|uniref:hypothetical protein n=1 Tax=Microbacterium gorillae TaxID=1231063 RepID=UPI003D978B27
MTIDVTVPVPEHRLAEFYRRVSDFYTNPETSPAATPGAGLVDGTPGWAFGPDADTTAAALVKALTDKATTLLRVLRDGALEASPRAFTPDELAAATGNPTRQSVAGILGGAGTAIKGLNLPLYRNSAGLTWHFVWHWANGLYSMTPAMARVLTHAGL